MSTASFLIPVYNGEKFIRETIDSCLNQTVQPQQIVIVDDCSTDNTPSILREYALAHPNLVTPIFSKKNEGRSLTRNKGLDVIKSDYCLLLDADDVAEPNRLERQVFFMDNNPDVCVSSSFVKYINSNGEVISKSILDITTREKYQEYMRTNEPIGLYTPAAIIRMSTFRDTGQLFRPLFTQAQDIDLWNRISEKHLIMAQPEFLTRYRIHGGSVTTKKFFKSRLYLEYIKDCIKQRRSGLAEHSWEEFIDLWNNRPFFKKVSSYRKTLAKKLFREAGFALGEKNTSNFYFYSFFQLSYSHHTRLEELFQNYKNDSYKV